MWQIVLSFPPSLLFSLSLDLFSYHSTISLIATVSRSFPLELSLPCIVLFFPTDLSGVFIV